ncbi:MAG: nitrite/sulfite reductase [Pseudomonadales bacterium]|nr:nitrite/sulfite reductase [Pseudomonadales bacterium]
MYVYTEYDQKLLDERVAQYRDQTRRYFAGELKEEEYLPLRLQNGLYVQRHAPMLRVAVPYGLLRSDQVRMLASIAQRYDKGYAHVSTRQNFQFNWPALEVVPDILADLASVQMHAIQTSGNCIRNVTTDQFAGVIRDEIEDPRPYAELIRQWSTFHPEFAYLPRKFKIAITGSADEDRAAVRFHDIGLEMVKNDQGEVGFKVLVGGGLGRTPIIAEEVVPFLPKQHIISYLEAILRVYNRYGRRDNKYKARIKILVKALGVEAFRDKVEQEWNHLKESRLQVPEQEFERLKGFFIDPEYADLVDQEDLLAQQSESSPGFSHWLNTNCTAHKKPGYMAVTLSLKPTAVAPGDVTTEQLNAIADLSDKYSFSLVRSTHDQNVVLADVQQDKLFDLWQELKANGFATANIGKLTDMICCPGGDFCALANAKSIPVAEQIQRRFDDLDYLYDLGDIELNISGCMNACGHHHIGNIGILGVDKKGKEFYQVSLGGNSGREAAIGKILGPSFDEAEIADVIDKVIGVYVEKRLEGESFLGTVQRLGIDPFKEKVYA